MDGESVFRTLKAAWVWPAERKGQISQYVQFRHEFDLPADDEQAELFIMADSNYVAWINGQFVGTGQFSNYPEKRTYDTLPVGTLLRPGRNVLAVVVRYNGEGFHSYIPGEPGLIYVLRSGGQTVVSGAGVQWRLCPCYRSGPMPKLSRQLFVTFEYDARGEDDWRECKYAPNKAWSAIAPAEAATPPDGEQHVARPVERLKIGERTPSQIVAQGVFRRMPDESKTVAGLMHADFLSTRTVSEAFRHHQATPVPFEGDMELCPIWTDGDGVYVVVDLGREEAGFLEFDLEANEGAVVDVGHGEHLDDLRVRTEISGRNFANRYICKAGRNRFTHRLDRMAGRYLQLHIGGLRDRCVLNYAGCRPTDYPVEHTGRFQSPDSMQNRLYQTGVRTLHLCMHERYEDCPWREQALYSNDARNQALCGYYCFGEYDFPRASLALLSGGLRDDGYMEMIAPAIYRRTIPSFSFAWVLSVAEHHLHSGDTEFARSMMPTVRRLLDGVMDKLDGDLLPCPTGERFWHFYDWVEGMDGGELRKGYSHAIHETRFDAPLNMYLCIALDSASRLARACGDGQTAKRYDRAVESLRRAVHERLFSKQAEAYATTLGQQHYAELTQALAVLSGCAPGPVAERLLERIVDPQTPWQRSTFSQCIYIFEALMTDRQRFGPHVFERIDRDWGAMLLQGATSFWETLSGSKGISGGGSLCHGWSAIPVCFYAAYLLGIRPLTPGFASFEVNPVTGAAPSATGRVPTPHGPIDLTWQRVGDHVEYELRHPKGTEPHFPRLGNEDQVDARCL